MPTSEYSSFGYAHVVRVSSYPINYPPTSARLFCTRWGILFFSYAGLRCDYHSSKSKKSPSRLKLLSSPPSGTKSFGAVNEVAMMSAALSFTISQAGAIYVFFIVSMFFCFPQISQITQIFAVPVPPALAVGINYLTKIFLPFTMLRPLRSSLI